VVTMDDTFGDLPEADILIEGSRIAAVGPSLACHDAE
jgi:5-methylthioadenosine/S-adenosylhomocysteine deaminase